MSSVGLTFYNYPKANVRYLAAYLLKSDQRWARVPSECGEIGGIRLPIN